MGAGQSGGIEIDGSSMGYQVLRVYPNSPGSRAGLKAYFDFIIAIGNTRFNKENGSLREILKASVDQKLKMIVFNTRIRQTREVEIIPSTSWGGNGLLGVSIKHSSFDRADERVWHVLEVQPGSPAQQAGFIAEQDYVIGSDSILQENDDLYNLIETHEGKALKLFVYNAVNDNCREVICHPNSKWGGQGYLGCEFGHGRLHRIPYGEKGDQSHSYNDNPGAPLLKNERPMATTQQVTQSNNSYTFQNQLMQRQIEKLQRSNQPGQQLLQQALFDHRPTQPAQQPQKQHQPVPQKQQQPAQPPAQAQVPKAQQPMSQQPIPQQPQQAQPPEVPSLTQQQLQYEQQQQLLQQQQQQLMEQRILLEQQQQQLRQQQEQQNHNLLMKDHQQQPPYNLVNQEPVLQHQPLMPPPPPPTSAPVKQQRLSPPPQQPQADLHDSNQSLLLPSQLQQHSLPQQPALPPPPQMHQQPPQGHDQQQQQQQQQIYPPYQHLQQQQHHEFHPLQHHHMPSLLQQHVQLPSQGLLSQEQPQLVEPDLQQRYVELAMQVPPPQMPQTFAQLASAHYQAPLSPQDQSTAQINNNSSSNTNNMSPFGGPSESNSIVQ